MPNEAVRPVSARKARRVAHGPRSARRVGLDTFPLLCAAAGLPRPEAEIVFAPPRKYRADYLFRCVTALSHRGVIVERNGGIWTKGGHSTGRGIMRDYAKANLAQIQGWIYLTYTPEQLENGQAIQDLKAVIG